MKLLSLAFALSAALWLAGCRSAPVSYYTLTPADVSTSPGQDALPLVKVVLLLHPVPAEIDTTRIIVRGNDTQMRIEEGAQWTTPFADEFKGALVEALRRRFGLLVLTGARSNDTTVPRIDLALHRFEAVEGSSVAIAVDWSLAMPGKPRSDSLSCQRVVTARATGGLDGVAAAAQSAILQLADQMGAAVRVAVTGTTPVCQEN
jgi:uncharacterized lipoprotein YmbA